MSTKLTEIQIPPGYTADQADFYRRGYRDGELGAPNGMEGYQDDLQLAYALGGLAGALAARPPVAAKVKVHTRIGHERSLCGLAPKNGKYEILEFEAFFRAADDEQCAVCLRRVASKGYNIKGLRARFRNPQQLLLAA